jgi:hypothetical protein
MISAATAADHGLCRHNTEGSLPLLPLTMDSVATTLKDLYENYDSSMVFDEAYGARFRRAVEFTLEDAIGVYTLKRAGMWSIAFLSGDYSRALFYRLML